jgi:outer membrane protein OmpA-like peptidoglycan-associated protein
MTGTSVLVAQPSDAGDLGTVKRLAFAFQGVIYFIPDTTTVIPDLTQLQPVGTIFTPRLNVTPRQFEEGFPGISDRFEWFAIDYTADFRVATEGTYRFELLSDDGARLYIDGQLVVDNDGLHGPQSVEGSISLSRGTHAMRVQYYQGPRTEIALVLRYALGDNPLEVFDMEKSGTVEAERSNGHTRYTLGAEALFDLDKAELKPEADSVLAEIAAVFRADASSARMVIEGHTDDQGSDAHNLTLSNQRAQSVADRLKAHGVDPKRLVVKGYGEKRPRVPNDSEENRARNRRVEITVDD